jgi:hypothetical protein
MLYRLQINSKHILFFITIFKTHNNNNKNYEPLALDIL